MTQPHIEKAAEALVRAQYGDEQYERMGHGNGDRFLAREALDAAFAELAANPPDKVFDEAREAIIQSDDVIADGEEPFVGWSAVLTERCLSAAFSALRKDAGVE